MLESDGVPEGAITLEDQARDTVQNIQFSRAIMAAHGWRTAILVTEPHHIKRAMLIAQDAGLAVRASPASASPGWHTPAARWTNLARDAQALMMYQMRRIEGWQP